MNEDKRYAIHVDVTMLNQNYLCIGKTMSLYFLTHISGHTIDVRNINSILN